MTYWIIAIRFLWPWDSPGKNSGVGCHFLLQGSSQPKDGTCVSYVSCIGQVGSLPLVLPRKLRCVYSLPQLNKQFLDNSRVSDFSYCSWGSQGKNTEVVSIPFSSGCVLSVLKNSCSHTACLEKTLESSLDSKEIKLVNPNGSQP